MQKDTEMVHGEVKRGTRIICYLKEDQYEFLEKRRLKDLVTEHSEFIGFPIKIYVEKSKEEEVTDPEDEEVLQLRLVRRPDRKGRVRAHERQRGAREDEGRPGVG